MIGSTSEVLAASGSVKRPTWRRPSPEGREVSSKLGYAANSQAIE